MALQAGLAGHRTGGFQQQTLYQQLLPAVRQVLEIVFENEFDDSTVAITTFIINFRFHDGGDITSYLPPNVPDAVMTCRMLEAIAHWIHGKTKELDRMIPLAQSGLSFMAERAQQIWRQVEMACYQSSADEILVELIYTIVTELLGRDAACLGSAVGGMLVSMTDRVRLSRMCEWPTTLLGMLVRKLEEIQARVSKVALELYVDTGLLNYEDAKQLMLMFFQYYTVEATNGVWELHETADSEQYNESPFRVNLIDSFGGLLKLLCHLEELISTANATHEVALAVDFEGVKLCRHGALCLVQLTCSDDPRLVYVLDVHVLGKRSFLMQTPNGTCMKGVLEEQSIRKVWFDPRNDVDALYHQFGIMPRGIFDLQLAEVADRRERGHNVNYVQGLHKCLAQCPALQSEQKVFAEWINNLGKNLFEPQNGGSYEIFQQRPLNAWILIYAAHDSRYMLALYEQYIASIGRSWAQRVIRAGDQRARWCLYREYTIPGSEAPDF